MLLEVLPSHPMPMRLTLNNLYAENLHKHPSPQLPVPISYRWTAVYRQKIIGHSHYLTAGVYGVHGSENHLFAVRSAHPNGIVLNRRRPFQTAQPDTLLDFGLGIAGRNRLRQCILFLILSSICFRLVVYIVFIQIYHHPNL